MTYDLMMIAKTNDTHQFMTSEVLLKERHLLHRGVLIKFDMFDIDV